MKKIIFISFFLYLISVSILAQKVTMKLIQTKNTCLSSWQIIGDQNIALFSGINYLQNDSVTFNLEANQHYFLKISVSEINNPDTSLYTLHLGNEPLLLINSDIGKGDHIYPFFTGIRAVNAKIIGGTIATISEFPWQVYYTSGNFRCGGSIIADNWVVTAAHCTKNSTGGSIPASEMFVKVGANNPTNALEGKTYSVSEVIVHEGFDSQTLLDDIALLRLSDNINYANATPIKLITTDDVADGAIVPGVMSWVTGWGLTHITPNVFPTALQKVQLPVISNTQAATVWSSIPASDIMAGFKNGNKDACNGDSGGPMVVPVLGEYKLAGIVSWGSSLCNTYGAYTRISDFETWIRTNTGIARDYKPPSPAGDLIICQGTESSQYSIDPLAGATSYEWKVLPESAGVISGNSENASVLWNISYTGSVTIILRATINNKVSDWSKLVGSVVLNTKLLSQSRDTTLCADQPVTLNIGAEGYNLRYKWFKDNRIVQSGSTASLSFASATTDDSGEYKCEISGSCGTILSDIIKVTVYPLTTISYISPDSKVAFGNDVNLEVNANGHDLMYEWQKDGKMIENSNTSILVLKNLNAADIGLYRATVRGTCGTEISDSIYVYVKKPDFSVGTEVFLWPTIGSREFNVAISKDAYYNVRIYNSMGRKIRERTYCRYNTIFNISTMARGVYIVEVYNVEFRKTIKIIKE